MIFLHFTNNITTVVRQLVILKRGLYRCVFFALFFLILATKVSLRLNIISRQSNEQVNKYQIVETSILVLNQHNDMCSKMWADAANWSHGASWGKHRIKN